MAPRRHSHRPACTRDGAAAESRQGSFPVPQADIMAAFSLSRPTVARRQTYRARRRRAFLPRRGRGRMTPRWPAAARFRDERQRLRHLQREPACRRVTRVPAADRPPLCAAETAHAAPLATPDESLGPAAATSRRRSPAPVDRGHAAGDRLTRRSRRHRGAADAAACSAPPTGVPALGLSTTDPPVREWRQAHHLLPARLIRARRTYSS